MAALRRLLLALNKPLRFNSVPLPRNNCFWAQSVEKKGVQRSIAVGICLAAGGAVAYYCYQEMHNSQRTGYRLHRGILLPSLPAVAAKEQGRSVDLEDGDVHMSSHEYRFRMFSSVEYEGQLYMTPLNFIESLTMSEPKNKKAWRSLTKQELEKILSDTPPVWKGTSKLFRNLRERGIIAYTEYLFLLCILTKPHAGFKIAFNMFDADGNQMVDKREFLVLQEIFRKKNEKRERKGDAEKSAQLVLKKEPQEFVPRSYWDILRRGTSQVLFSDLAEVPAFIDPPP